MKFANKLSILFRFMAICYFIFSNEGLSIVSAATQSGNPTRVYIPLVFQSDQRRQGVVVPYEQDSGAPGSETFAKDIESLGVQWYYNYSGSSPISIEMASVGIIFIPMSYDGEDPKLPTEYTGYLLVFNEPDVRSQANLNQRQAVDRYLALKNKYKKAILVVGGVSAFVENAGWYSCVDSKGSPISDVDGRPIKSWISCFMDEFERRGITDQIPKYWHAHAYLNEGTDAVGHLKIEAAMQTLTSLHEKTGGNYWITEYSDVTGNVINFSSFTQWLKNQVWIRRFAPFATRISGNESWYPKAFWGLPQHVSLIDFSSSSSSNPILTNLGKAYSMCTK
jgi:hypothetical protein